MDEYGLWWAIIMILVATMMIITICDKCGWCPNFRDGETTRLMEPLAGTLVICNNNLLNECAVCLDNFNIGDQMRILNCGHYYHQKCIDPWLSDSRTCPKCRGENIV